MSPRAFRAFLVTENADGTFKRSITKRSVDELPPGELLIKVQYSSLNYKDALSATGNRGVTRRYPHVPGIDAAGRVEESSVPEFRKGDEVLVTGYEMGSNVDGGFAEYVRVPAAWVVRKPAGLALRESMICGTAGFTAALGLHRLLHHGVTPDKGPVLVTGATGGVGCLGVALFAQAGFYVVAATGKLEERGFLTDLGAREVISREDAADRSGRGLLTGRWAGALDTVGGFMLDAALRHMKPDGAVACCGNITSAELQTSIYPFILRGVSLLGINSAFTPMPTRLHIWDRLATDWKSGLLERVAFDVSLEELPPLIDEILRGRIRGRILVNLQR